MSKKKEQKDNLKELEIPYIGIKVESIPTILKLLKESDNDDFFIKHYTDIGKTEKTAREYLRSLRNLNLAYLEKESNQTRLKPSGLSLIQDKQDLIYKNLLSHCLKQFNDFKIIKEYIKKYKPSSSTKLLEILNENGYTISRKRSLDSYFKFFYEAEFIKTERSPTLLDGDDIEYNHLFKYIKNFCENRNTKEIVIGEFKKYLSDKLKNKKIKFNDEILSELLLSLQRNKKIKLFNVDPSIIDDFKDYIIINNKYYFSFEVSENG